MQYIKAFFQFWYQFIIGDDWTIATAVVAGLAVTFWLANSSILAWWLMPVVSIATLGSAVWRGSSRSD